MKLIEIPGGMAEIRDRLTSERQRRPLKAAWIAAQGAYTKLRDRGITDDMSDDEAERVAERTTLTLAESSALLEVQDASIVAFLQSWTLPRPLPTIENVQDLEPDLYEALANATKDLAASALVDEPNFTPSKDIKDGSPTPASESSSSPSVDAEASEATSPQIPTSSFDTAPLSGESSSLAL